jgi:glycosyltransferase involved in cell wall biosynthesis
MSRAFLICPEPVRDLTAGVGTRFVTLAGVLAGAGHRVTLALPNDPDEAGQAPDGVDLVRAEPDRLGSQASGHDWVLLHGHLGNHYLSQRDDLPVVVDLYDPFLVENLHYHRELGLEPYRNDHATWRLQMGRGDLFLCSSEEQRLYYLGWLTALGRVHPLAVERDPTLSQLIVEVPFGTADEQPPGRLDRCSVLAGVPEDAPVLYFGGIYDWYDPFVLLEAMPPLLDHHPGLVVVFVEHPHPELTPLSVASRARELSRERGWLGREVRFEPWRPFPRRFELARVADLAVVTHRPGLETDLSLRTRLVDLLWLGVPVVATAGGTMARVVRESGAGEVVAPGDRAALVEAVDELLGDAEIRRRASAAGRAWAATRRWREAAAPLLGFAEEPWRDGHRGLAGVGEVEAPRRSGWRRLLARLGGGR